MKYWKAGVECRYEEDSWNTCKKVLKAIINKNN